MEAGLNFMTIGKFNFFFFMGLQTELLPELFHGNDEIKLAYQHCDKIFVFHTLFPDMVTFIKDEP